MQNINMAATVKPLIFKKKKKFSINSEKKPKQAAWLLPLT